MHGSRPHLHTPLGHVGSDRGAPPGLRHTQLHPCLTSVPGGPIPDLQPTQGLSRLVSGPPDRAGRGSLNRKRLKDGTRIEVLQLPLDDSQRPESDRTVSEGRFVALQKGFLDPATLPEGTRVTLVGEVTGVMTLPLDETEYAYPTLEIKTLKVWPDWTAWQDESTAYRNPLWGPYRGGAYWGSPYWWGPGWGYRGCCPSWHQGQRTTPRALHRFRPAR